MSESNARRREVLLLLAAVQYFTRIPVPPFVGHSQQALNAAARYFPAVGLLVGAIGAATLWGASLLWPPLVAVLVSTATTVWLTGAFHEDGLADAIDGLGGSFTRERALEIMRDSRIGTYGALTIVFATGTKVAALASFAVLHACVLLVVAHCASRAAAVWIMRTLPYVREDESKAKPLVQAVSLGTVSTALTTGVAALLAVAFVDPRPAVAAVLALTVAVIAWRQLLRRRLGGYTGDCLGATQQLAEVAIYLGALAAWST
jgi:adenosylcobinamide-GDP ribazoletransferase